MCQKRSGMGVLTKRLYSEEVKSSGVLCTMEVSEVSEASVLSILCSDTWFGIDTKLLHPCDERSPLEPKASGSPAWSANPAVGFFEGADDLIAIDFGENAPHGRTSFRSICRLRHWLARASGESAVPRPARLGLGPTRG